MYQRWRAVDNTVSDLIGPRFEPQTSRSRDKCVTARPAGQLQKPTAKLTEIQRRIGCQLFERRESLDGSDLGAHKPGRNDLCSRTGLEPIARCQKLDHVLWKNIAHGGGKTELFGVEFYQFSTVQAADMQQIWQACERYCTYSALNVQVSTSKSFIQVF